VGNVKLKWPNDLYIGPLKTGGILIVNQLQGLKWASSVIGIGINVNQTSFDPALPNPTSLSIQTSNVLNLKHLLDNILFQIEQDYNQYLRSADFDHISSAYHKYADVTKVTYSGGCLRQ
jgi:BirA family biotin operon repressor/biotin-[acetyl-CoA-carboxylase] ligase